jgi:hypothetical protein
MVELSSEESISSASRMTFTIALVVFVGTIVIGVLNGLDVYNPGRDILSSHTHAGTLGWITLALTGVALLLFTEARPVSVGEGSRIAILAYGMTAAIVLYVAAFFAGDLIPGDRIHRPIVGGLLFVVVIWFFAWIVRANQAYPERSVARLGMILAWIALIVGAALGVALGIFTSQGEIPGLADDTAVAIADAHPPAMVVGFLLLAAMAAIEWRVLADRGWTRAGSAQMWMLFVAGMLINIGFVSGLEEELLGPANLLMIVGVVMLVVRSWSHLTPSAWTGAGTAIYNKIAIVFLVVYLVLGTAIIVQVISGAMDFDALTDSQFGLALTFDHIMFIGVMTNVIFGVLAAGARGNRLSLADRFVLWGVNIGIVGFGVGLITVTAAVKRTFTPLLGAALLFGIVAYVQELNKRGGVEPASPLEVDRGTF